MKKNMSFFILFIGLFLISVTLSGFFLLGFNTTSANWWGIGFCLFAEVLLILIFILFKTKSMHINKVFIRLGVFAVVIIYFVMTIILCIFSSSFERHLNLYIFLEILLFASAAIAIIMFFLFYKKNNNKETKNLYKRKNIQPCEMRVYDLIINTNNKAFRTKLNKLYEQIKDCDKYSFCCADKEILESIDKLEEIFNNSQRDDALINKTLNEITEFLSQYHTLKSEN